MVVTLFVFISNLRRHSNAGGPGATDNGDYWSIEDEIIVSLAINLKALSTD